MTYTPVIETQSDLRAAWCHLMGPLGFGSCSVWMMLIRADGTPLPQLTEITDAGEPPSADALSGLVSHLAAMAEDHPGARWAFLRCRPGRHGVDDRDRAWAQMLLTASRGAGVPADVVHLATDERLVPLPFDDLALPA